MYIVCVVEQEQEEEEEEMRGGVCFKKEDPTNDGGGKNKHMLALSSGCPGGALKIRAREAMSPHRRDSKRSSRPLPQRAANAPQAFRGGALQNA